MPYKCRKLFEQHSCMDNIDAIHAEEGVSTEKVVPISW